ncbi:hypothetical protein [Cognatilysobacter lacus]|nr:hypothetical protein [Lysobacter lacus]
MTPITPRRLRPLHIVLIAAALVVIAIGIGGYHVGRDMAHRDNARAESAR